MRSLITLSLTIFLSSCLGQYPKLRISPSGKVYNANAQTKKEMITTDDTKPERYYDTTYGQARVIIIDTHHFYMEGDTLYYLINEQQVDSAEYYFKKYIYYKSRMNDELEKINRLENPQLTRKIKQFQDSCTRYHDLLQKLKKK